MAVSIEEGTTHLRAAPSLDEFLEENLFPPLRKQKEDHTDVSQSILSMASTKVLCPSNAKLWYELNRALASVG